MQALLRPGTPFGPGPVKCRAAGSLLDVLAQKEAAEGASPLGERVAAAESGEAGEGEAWTDEAWTDEAWTDVARTRDGREAAERPCPEMDTGEGEGGREGHGGNATDTAQDIAHDAVEETAQVTGQAAAQDAGQDAAQDTAQEAPVTPSRGSEASALEGAGGREAQAPETAASGAAAGEAPPESSGSAAGALLDLLDDGWFMGNVAWSGGGWGGGGGWSLSTIKEAQDEEQGEEDEDEEGEGEGRVGGGERAGDAQGGEGTVGEGQVVASFRQGPPGQADFSSPPREASGADSRELSRESASAEQDQASKPLVFSARRRPISPYSSDEETVQSNRASRSRRGRSGARQRRTKRSSSADTTARGPWLADPGAQEGSAKGGAANAGRAGRVVGSHTPPLRPAAPPPPVDERTGRPRFLRTRSVSDYETRGPRVTSLWNTPPGVASKPKSLTDADVEELQGFFDLGFKFQQDQISPQITATLPALRLYQVVGTVQQRLLQRQSLPAQAPQSLAEPAVPFPTRARVTPQGRQSTSEALLRSSASASSLPGENSWSIADPNDNPVDVKTNLRLWAQAVASTVRQTC